MKTIALHILDLLQNSITANSTLIRLDVVEDLQKNLYEFTISDNGKGMSREFLAKVTDPYTTSRTTRKVGLGLPLIKMNAEQAGGSFLIESEVGKGTKTYFSFAHNNIDRPPLGDIAGSVVLCAAQNESIRWIYTHKTPFGEYIFDTDEIKEALDGMSMNNYKIMQYLEGMIKENLEEIQVSE
ncbi:ATP-binding protein [Bacteroidales bacterium OttesenSCG-928-C19]|nr:ATP-binding protein [Bacteroidales bacterium OttesenSCG-928-C19]